jgi:RES domain-containing protein
MTAGPAQTVSVWRIATDTPDYTADDMSGTGAKLTGGRWNRKGGAVIYSARSIALACLETLAHLELGGLPLNRYLVRIDIPVMVWEKRTILISANHVGRDAQPAGKVSLDLGDVWLSGGDTALIEVPSVIVPEEHNILINPVHPDSQTLAVTKLRKWLFDARLN